MKSKVISIFLVFLLSVSITGCSSKQSSLNKSQSSSSNNNKAVSTSPSSSSTVAAASTVNNTAPSGKKAKITNNQVSPDSGKNSAIQAYREVLENKAEFFSTDNKKSLFLNDFLTNKQLYNITFNLTRFTTVYMDNDKIPEVVLELSVGGYPSYYEVLHYMNGKVYGYLQVYRALEMLKVDGTFLRSGGAFDNEYAKMRFTQSATEIDVLGYEKSSQGNGGVSISYFINNKPVTKEAFEAFSKEQNAKKDVTWYEFSKSNIETKITF